MGTENVEQLLREGIAAARTGDKSTAKQKLQQVVALDPQNEKGWYWLASVVDTDDERRVCLGNVIVINPGNARAKALLESLDRAAAEGSDRIAQPESEKEPFDRRVLIIGGVAAVVVLLLLVLIVGSLGGGAPTPTAVSLSTATSVPTTAVALAAQGSTTATVQLPGQRITLPPTWTPPPSFTPVGVIISTPLAAPSANVPGQLVIASGSDLGNNTFPMFLMRPTDKSMRPLVPEDRRGDYGLLTPGGQLVVYMRYYQGADAFQIHVSTLDGTDFRDASILWGNNPPVGQQQMPSLSRDGRMLAFVGFSLTENEATPGIFAVPFAYAGKDTKPGTVMRITAKDHGDNTWPTLSPDGRQIVFANKSATGTDLYLVTIGEPSANNPAAQAPGAQTPAARAPGAQTPGSVPPTKADTGAAQPTLNVTLPAVGAAGAYAPIAMAGGNPQPLTNDGDTLIEAAPEFSPDGAEIAYQAMGSDKLNKIYLMPAAGGPAKVLVEGGNNIRPHWSPDGHFIAFSSTRGGKWEVYIVEVATQKLYQVTQTKTPFTWCTGWGQ